MIPSHHSFFFSLFIFYVSIGLSSTATSSNTKLKARAQSPHRRRAYSMSMSSSTSSSSTSQYHSQQSSPKNGRVRHQARVNGESSQSFTNCGGMRSNNPQQPPKYPYKPKPRANPKPKPKPKSDDQNTQPQLLSKPEPPEAPSNIQPSMSGLNFGMGMGGMGNGNPFGQFGSFGSFPDFLSRFNPMGQNTQGGGLNFFNPPSGGGTDGTKVETQTLPGGGDDPDKPPKTTKATSSGRNGGRRRPGESSPNPKGTDASSASDKERWTKLHNRVRALYNTPKVTWSDSLAASAKRVSDTCIFRHSHGQFGENIAAGQPSIDEVVREWAYNSDECQAYDPRNPVFSHFTQILWRSTVRIGCAITKCPNVGIVNLPNAHYYVCQYDPPGNYEGRYAENVNAGRGECIGDT